MNKTGKRLLTFFIGMPIVLAIVFFDYMNHLALQIIIGIFAIIQEMNFTICYLKKCLYSVKKLY